jgi:hypothetical protein
MKPENWIGIAQIVITIIGMVIAPLIAVRLSIRQFRSTKSWEKATEAYSAILAQLAIVKHTNRRYYEHFLNTAPMDERERGELSKEYQDALKTLERLSISQMLFISGQASKAIQILVQCIETATEANDIVKELEKQSGSITDCIASVTCSAPKQHIT